MSSAPSLATSAPVGPEAAPAPLPLLILAVGNPDAETARTLGDFSDWIAAGLQGQGLPVQVLDPRQGDTLPDPQQLAGVVITGSHAMVTERAPWSEAVAAWLRKAVPQGLPTLGICYGHQLLADALGGQADDHPGGLELGTVDVQSLPAARSDPLFAHLPPRFKAQVVHRQRALRLPEGAVPLAANAWEAHQAFRIGDWAWGVQFHPEFSAPAMQAYVDRLGAEAAMPASVAPTPEAASLLPRFAQLAHMRATA